MENKNFDVVIVGSGPAGMTAGIYALRCGLSVAIIENKMIGGQATLTYEINNFPGYKSISGMDLSMAMNSQVEELGAVTIFDDVKEINLSEKFVLCSNDKYYGKSIILAMGASARRLGVDKEEKLTGSGVAYCAVCDGSIFKAKDVVLVGGGNSAVEDAIYLSKIVNHLTIVNITESFNCQQTLLNEFNKISELNNNINVFHNHVVSEINGDNKLEAVVIKDVKTNEMKTVACEGMFVAIGRKPDTDLVKGQIELDKHGYIIADENMHTSVSGVFVAGDVRVKNLRQIITACADGAIAGTEANSYINKL